MNEDVEVVEVEVEILEKEQRHRDTTWRFTDIYPIQNQVFSSFLFQVFLYLIKCTARIKDKKHRQLVKQVAEKEIFFLSLMDFNHLIYFSANQIDVEIN